MMAVVRKYEMLARVLMCVSDTTGNMVTLGRHLREKGVEHGFCLAHLLHLVALLAFDGKYDLLLFICICICILIS